MFIQILGEDVAGIVAQVGSSVTKVKKGDRVLGHCISLTTGNNAHAGFQNYSILPEITVSPIPDSLSFEQAAVVPLGLSTAAAALYQKGFLNLPYPKTGSTKSSGKSILIWGGSSSVGGNAIQLAVASGVQVVATCSKRNFDYVKGLGATHVFDYNSDSVIDEIVEALQGTKFAGVFDSISEENTWKACGAVAEKLGGGIVAGTLGAPKGINLGKGVSAKDGKSRCVSLYDMANCNLVFAVTIALQEPDVGNAIYRDFLPGALKSGQFKAKPDPKVAGHGLEKIQDGFEALKKGVSAVKVVVTL
jgi:NADPH:quinone reductase-like Zn-dependent oxidoreductase